MTRSSKAFRVGTRGSKLSLIQTRGALDKLRQDTGLRFDIVPASSPGDRDRAADLRDVPDDFFTRDLDEKVLRGEVDCALHSAKDLAYPLPDGLDWVWLPWASDRRDALVLPRGKRAEDLPEGALIGVSSDRRAAYCARRFPRAKAAPIRGNVEQRVAKVDSGQYDALITAAAALIRLGMEDRITEWIPLADLDTPEGQGTLAVTFRRDHERLLRVRSLYVKTVVFVGAGPGSKDTCIIGGAEALRHCDSCLYDALACSQLLELLPAEARRLDVGKRCGSHRRSQQETNQLLLDECRKGRRVVRLKGGDPGIFARLAEEIDALEGHSLPYRVLPGVTSLTAGTTGTGMLLTGRDLSPGFTAMTARRKGGALADVTAQARAALPVVFFMGTRVADDISRALIADGIAPATPAAFVFGAGTEEQAVVRGTLEELPQKVSPELLKMPGLFIVGEPATSAFRKDFGALGGRRVLLTCSEALQARAARAVLDLGGVPIQRPLIRLTPDPDAVQTLQGADRYDWLVITSPASVRCMASLMADAQIDLRRLPPIITAGTGTADELRSAGIYPEVIARRNFGTGGVIDVAQSELAPGCSALRLRSDIAGSELAEGLQGLGLRVEELALYGNESIHYDQWPRFDAALFASSSAARVLADEGRLSSLEGKTVVAIGRRTAETLKELGVQVDAIPRVATVAAAVHALAAEWVKRSLEEMR